MKLLFVIFYCLPLDGLAIMVRKFVYQKDMSEHCRRRVLPSIFVGRHIAEAHSQILHFSKMELPYSCFISVRTESGSNIILVVQLLSDESLVRACSENVNQFLVYEMGETFGGYWGAIPDSLVRAQPLHHKSYILKMPSPTTEDVPSTTTELPEETTTDLPTTNPSEILTTDGDYVRMEIPLLNVSGGRLSDIKGGFHIEELFDAFYDVGPRPEGEYETSMFPLVQFSIEKEPSRRFGSDREPFPQYDRKMSTTNTRLQKSTTKRMSQIKQQFDKFINFNKKTNSLYVTQKQSHFDSVWSETTIPSFIQRNRNDFVDSFNDSMKTTIETWEDIDSILKMLKQGYLEDVNTTANESIVLDAILNINDNYSAYLDPTKATIWEKNTSPAKMFSRKLVPKFRSTHIDHLNPTTNLNITYKHDVTSQYQKPSENIVTATNINYNTTVKWNDTINTNYNGTTYDKMVKVTEKSVIINDSTTSTKTSLVTQNSSNESNPQTEEFRATSPLTGLMVDHESWENVVQAAPVMAILLNHTSSSPENPGIKNDSLEEKSTTPMRKKRTIEPIPVEPARPSMLTTRLNPSTEDTSTYGLADLQEFAHLVELQDDELHDRIALRYMRQYVGPLLFNICEFNEPKTRHVFLFNSSRIAIALNNFTMERMTVMLTPARTILGGGNDKCSPASLECQVFGTRVCIDTMNACDGVPNCGAYDIYDEDRLMCGAAIGLQHNVYLAAMTFLAVLLTLLYTVHYWLRRCVPKVSEAFFIYTDEADNILYLESVMRSPNELNYNPKLYEHSSIIENGDKICAKFATERQNGFLQCMKACFLCIFCKRRKVTPPEFEFKNEPSSKLGKTFSFTVQELNKMAPKKGIDECVQTGESIEMSYIDARKEQDTTSKLPHNYERRKAKHLISVDSTEERRDYRLIEELNMLKYFKKEKNDSIQQREPEINRISFDSTEKQSTEEEELNILTYEQERPSTSYAKQQSFEDIIEPSVSYRPRPKHLRFEKMTAAIPTEGEEENEYETSSYIIGDEAKKKGHDMGTIASDDVRLGMNRDIKRFWVGKGKKTKKKLPLSKH